MGLYKIILASASPRRKELLSYLNIDFTIIPSKKDENASGSPEEVVKSLALQKASDIASKYKDCFVIGADTIVCLDNKVLGKPKNKDDAFRMLSMLSGRKHRVLTGVCVYSPISKEFRIEYDSTDVYFDDLSDEEINAYIATGEPFDKAGSYAIQGIGGAMISRIDGCASNVIGLPLPLLKKMLIEQKAVAAWLK